MIISKIKRPIDMAVSSLRTRYKSWNEAKYDYEHIQYYLSADNKLTRDEKSLIAQKWEGVFPNVKIGFNFFRGLKSLLGFDPNFLPSSYFYHRIEMIMNPQKWKYILSHKGMLEMVYQIGVKHPKTIYALLEDLSWMKTTSH